MIRARALEKTYRDSDGQLTPVLTGANLDVATADFLAVLGPSGSGKSTLLHILGGLDVDYAGEVSVNGLELSSLSERELSRFRNTSVGFVFQSFHLIPNMSALDNVMLPAFFRRTSTSATELRKAEAALDRVGLISKKDRVPANLSGGERQRVAIARAIFSDPKVLFCDEPTGNLDASTGEQIIALFQQLHRDGLTVVAVTHEARVSNAAKKVLTLREGKLHSEPEIHSKRSEL